MSDRPLLLDLFCGAGGAAAGYYRSGFRILGIDIEPQPNYPYKFIRGNALEIAATLAAGGNVGSYGLADVTVIHASPPCQAYSITSNVVRENKIRYPMLIEPVRDLLKATGKPYVIENVQGAARHMIEPLTLCGSQFGLTTWWEPYGLVGLQRHRLFESNILIPDAGSHDHSLRSVPVYGGGPSGKRVKALWPTNQGLAQAGREVMRIGWMTRDELEEAIPPVFTEYIGGYMIDAIRSHGDR